MKKISLSLLLLFTLPLLPASTLDHKKVALARAALEDGLPKFSAALIGLVVEYCGQNGSKDAPESIVFPRGYQSLLTIANICLKNNEKKDFIAVNDPHVTIDITTHGVLKSKSSSDRSLDKTVLRFIVNTENLTSTSKIKKIQNFQGRAGANLAFVPQQQPRLQLGTSSFILSIATEGWNSIDGSRTLLLTKQHLVEGSDGNYPIFKEAVQSMKNQSTYTS